ncbi:hypothetical protein IWW39_002973 [Coemansia spiralis]|uniref:Uncharacterized protein n=1 Tax=Coemansia spiralis TaxID=417178 RepID=A0A9W8GM16_9FUNG|nr:hypothetical protein IWW39_002973 [Coemansia spiralis]
MAADTPALSLDAAPKTPTTARGQRSMLRKNSATGITDGQVEPPVTPSRRSTRTAAIRATGLIHDAVEEITGSRRKATPARKADYNSGQSSGDDAVPKTPTRRTREPPASLLSPTTRRATRSSSAERELEGSSEIPPPLATPRKRAAASRKPATSETEEDAANTLALFAATPRKRSTRGNAADGDESAEAAVKTPARRGRSSKATTTVADELGEAAEAIKSPTRRGRGRQTKAQKEEEAAADDEASADVETESLAATTAKTSQSGSASLPPPHPDLAGVAKKLASMAVELEVRDSSEILSTTQSVDGEEFRTAPESPEKAASQVVVAAPIKEEDDEISDLSDVEDPHFTKIMTAAAESATMSAAESIAGSDIEGETEPTTSKRALGAASSGKSATHISFDSDVEMDSEPEQIAAPAAQKPADSDSDDDEAPEVVVTSRAKAGGESQPKQQQTGASESDADSVVPDAKSSKKRRPRHRKRPVSVTAAQHAAAALDKMAQLNRRPGHVLPSEIPEELRVDLDSELAARAAAFAAQGAKASKAGDKLDLAVLEQFASESKKRSGEDTSAKKSKKRKHKKRQGDESSRVVSGIRVVANEQPTTKTGLLENLAQSVPPKVRRFAKEERSGGRRIKRCDPLVAIARRGHHAAINFFKPGTDATL